MPKTALVTGSTDGIGKQTALVLAAKGYRVLVHGRSEARAKDAAEEIRGSSGNADVDFVTGDLSSQREIHRLADQVRARCSKLEVLINNAGVYQDSLEYSPDGIEMTFAVNHMAPFLLTRLLLDLLKASAPSRIITVSSMLHARDINFGNLQGEMFYDGAQAYAISKLCNILFTYRLAALLEGTGVTANCLHPGVIDTKLLRKAWEGAGSPVAEGSRTSVYLADAAEVEGVTGKYFVNMKESPSAPASHSREIQDNLWKISETLIMPKI